MQSGQVIVFIIGTLVVIFAAYYFTYYIGVKASGQGRGRLNNKSIKLLDRFAISKDKSFCIVEIAGKIYVIGVTNQSMTLIDTLDAAAFNESAAERRVTQSWHAVPGGRITRKLTNKLAQFIARMMGRTPGGAGSPGGETFEESMRAAREKDQSGQPDRA